MKRLYLSGPMRGRPEHNYPAFNAAAALFRSRGWIVVNPAEVGALFCHSTEVSGADYIREDLLHLARCQAIALLPEWDHSTGARCEVAVAITLGLPFFDASTGEPISPPSECVIAGGYERSPGRIDTLDGLAAEAHEWQCATFPNATAASKVAHLAEEVVELAAEPGNPGELADCFLLIVGAAAVAGVDLRQAVRDKLEVNKRRKWGTPDANGVVKHVAEGAQT